MAQTTQEQPAATDAPPRRRPGRLLLLIAVAALAVVGLIVAVAAGRRPAPSTATGATGAAPPRLGEGAPLVGEPLPATTLPPLGDLGPADGFALPPDDGEPLIVNFWASWCAPCVNEMPLLQRVADDLEIRLVGVDFVDPQTDEAIALADELGITYPLVTDELGEYGEDVGLFGTPTTLLVDADGVVRSQLTGELTEDQLRAAVANVR
jgi:cytochrome c biogenesis protein CcmG/thiol:disulfide interchange protein DsbE